MAVKRLRIEPDIYKGRDYWLQVDFEQTDDVDLGVSSDTLKSTIQNADGSITVNYEFTYVTAKQAIAKPTDTQTDTFTIGEQMFFDVVLVKSTGEEFQLGDIITTYVRDVITS